jgi:imidazole glycerol phosphate synthase glutamine amidotransferase subunit
MSPLKVGVLDYGMGNLRSVAKALEAAGGRVSVSDDRKALEKSGLLVVPGQGAFGAAAQVLKKRGLVSFLKDWLAADRPFFGVCLGMQILFESSEESPGVKGLGVLPGRVRRFRPRSRRMKVPHMGWNRALPGRARGLFADVLPASEDFYFVHSYYADPEDRGDVWAETDYGGRFCSAVAKGSMAATQFHPEKSGAAGQALLKKLLQRASKGHHS